MLIIGFICLAAPLRAQFAYEANVSSSNVWGYSIGANGALTPVPGSPFAAGIGGGSSMALDPAGKFAYVVGNNNVSAFSIGANGALTQLTSLGSPFATGNNAVSVTVDRTGRFVYVANGGDNTVSAYSISAGGGLTPVPGSPFATGRFPFSVAVEPTGKFVYVANVGGNVSAYSIGARGALTPIPGSPFAAGGQPSFVTFTPTGKFAYVANATSNNISAYSIGADGVLTPLPGSPFATGHLPVGLAVEPTGKFAYVANGGDNEVWAYSIGVNGVLTPTGPHFVTGRFPFSVAIDPTGKFLYVANNNGNSVSAYSIGAGGALTQLKSLGSPYAAGAIPRSIVVTPLVPFATSFAKLTIAKQGFGLGEFFTLGATSNGINPLTESLTLQIGTFSVTIPPGSFKQIALRIFVFQGAINGVDLSVQIVALGNNIFALAAESKGVDLTGLTNPVTVVLTVGANSGSTDVTAQKVEKKPGSGTAHRQP
jgi:6-phosphogluconolactonase